uniref:Uncharacterized protein n=1 Tax=Cucumis melo TaxID=3656 RepID=A0A9I9E5R6_CUCME
MVRRSSLSTYAYNPSRTTPQLEPLTRVVDFCFESQFLLLRSQAIRQPLYLLPEPPFFSSLSRQAIFKPSNFFNWKPSWEFVQLNVNRFRPQFWILA